MALQAARAHTLTLSSVSKHFPTPTAVCSPSPSIHRAVTDPQGNLVQIRRGGSSSSKGGRGMDCRAYLGAGFHLPPTPASAGSQTTQPRLGAQCDFSYFYWFLIKFGGVITKTLLEYELKVQRTGFAFNFSVVARLCS